MYLYSCTPLFAAPDFVGACLVAICPLYSILMLLDPYSPLLFLTNCDFPSLPQAVRASLLHSLSSMGSAVLSTSTRPEWLPLLHNVALFHSTVRVRGEVYDHAWSTKYIWTHAHLMVGSFGQGVETYLAFELQGEGKFHAVSLFCL